MKNKPWFATLGRPGDRTLEQQLMGLDPLWAEIEGKTVLDVGCAEGLITAECKTRGAAVAIGWEIRADAVRAARISAKDVPGLAFECQDANIATPRRSTFDIVLMLAVLHKLKDPSAACVRLAQAAKDLVVIRLPPKRAPLILDERSNNQPHDIGLAMASIGFKCVRSGFMGPFGEWMGYYRRMS